ncbi:adhesion G protein-coupled receptor L2-like isoform X2 [Mya arenaria]|uniref:adhesion G protein-coupled receptor L2-like isoform X2 n=1 Tax=Mya arenaria TaxID=6604 RepID=UPI0022DF2A71|nr:adhesion G protein-coupled receptor L2-like isoform X2 [Mya arenaria]
MEGYVIWFILLLGVVQCLTAEYPARYPENEKRKNFACENSFVNLQCKLPGERIRILLANYGRFSLYVCGMGGIDKDWNVQCSAEESISIISQRCDHKSSCDVQASSAIFGDPCPNTPKYLQITYFCYLVEENGTSTAPSTTAQKVTTGQPPPVSTEGQDYHVGTTEPGDRDHGNGSSLCKGREEAGLIWPSTMAGHTHKVICPQDQTGAAAWRCGSDGQWAGSPDLSDCVSMWMENIQAMIDTDQPADEAIKELNSKIKGKSLQAGDLKRATIHVLPGLITKMKKEIQSDMSLQDRRNKVHSFSKAIVKSGSSLLDQTQHSSWQLLDSKTRKQSATWLIVSLEQMALEVAATINTEETVSSSELNIVMEVSVIRPERSLTTNMHLPRMQYATDSPERQHDVSLPIDSIMGISSSDDVTVTYLQYNNLDTLMDPSSNPTLTSENTTRYINSDVISASVTKHSRTAKISHAKTRLTRPMTYTLSHNDKDLKDQIPVCAYWSYNASTLQGDWSTEGCWVAESNIMFTTCQCDHLTNFAVLMDVTGTKLNLWHMMSLQAITYVGCTVSIICLLMCFISFTIFRNLQSDRNTIHKNLVLCLMLAELLFLFGIAKTDPPMVCSVIAGFLHFFFLCVFSWMCLEGIQLYFMLIEVFEAERSRKRWFYCFGYGMPALIVAISAAIDHTGYGTETHCWLRTDNYFVLSFVVPAAVVILINIVMLSIAVYMMCRHAGVTASSIQARQKGKLEKMGNGKSNSIVSDDTTSVTSYDLPTWLKGSAVLVVLLGLTWTFGFVYVNADTVAVAYLFTILNSLQGLFIFIFHCFMDRKVKKEWRRAIYKAKWLPMCCRINLGGYHGTMSSPTPTSSSGGNYFIKFWSSRKRKRSSTSSATGKHRRSDLDSFLRSDTSSGCTVGTALNRYSNQSEKLLPNGGNVYCSMPTHFEGGIVGDLSVVEGSIVDSEYMTEYCQHALQVTNEKKNYSSGEEDSDVDDKDNISISKDRLSLLSKESMPKLNADFTSDNEEGKVNYAVLQEGKTVKMAAQTESERALFNDLLSMYKTMDGKNEALIPTVRVCTSHQKLESGEGLGCEKGENKDITKSAPNLKAPTFSAYSNQTLDTTSEPLLGSMPDVAVAVEHQEFIEE